MKAGAASLRPHADVRLKPGVNSHVLWLECGSCLNRGEASFDFTPALPASLSLELSQTVFIQYLDPLSRFWTDLVYPIILIATSTIPHRVLSTPKILHYLCMPA